MKQRRAFLDAGHSTTPGRDMGAASKDGKYIEGLLTAEFRCLVFNALLKKYKYRASVDSNDSITSQTIALFKKWTTPRCLLISFHFNSVANSSVSGVESFVPVNASEFEIAMAHAFSRVLNQVTGSPLRGNYKGAPGVKDESQSHHKRLAWMRVTGENVLVELEFLSNPEAMKVWDIQKYTVADKFADVIFDFVNR